MGLLGNGWEDPQSSAIMALAGGLLKGDFGGGLLGANDAFAQAKQNAFKQKFMGMQMQNYASEIEQRKAAIAKQQQLMEMANRIIGGGGGSAPAAPGQMGSGSFGVVPPPAGMSDMPTPRPSGLGGASLNDIVALHAAGGPDLLNAYKLAREGFERKPGTFYEGINGGREYVPDPTKGFTFQNGRVGLLPGFTDATTATTLATEAPKTLLNSAANVNLRKNPDGTESPVSSLAENPTLQNVLGGIFGRPVAPAATPQPMMGGPRPMVSPADQRGADAESIRMIQAELQNPNLSPTDKAALQREVSRLTAAQSMPGFPTPTMVRPGIGYGKTTAQETQDAVNKEAALGRQKDIGEQRKAIMAADFSAPSNIAKYTKIGQLLSDVDGGKFTPMGTDLASAMNSLGFKVDKNLGNKQAAMALANEAALQLRNPAGGAGMPGAMSDQDRNFLASMTPNLTQSAEGRKQVIDAYIATQRRSQQVAQFARNYEKKYGKLDNGFFDQLSAWSNANPMFGAK